MLVKFVSFVRSFLCSVIIFNNISMGFNGAGCVANRERNSEKVMIIEKAPYLAGNSLADDTR